MWDYSPSIEEEKEKFEDGLWKEMNELQKKQEEFSSSISNYQRVFTEKDSLKSNT